MNKIKLFIFDMDGLMFDTERLVYGAYIKAAEKYDFEINSEVFKHVLGKTQPDIIATLLSIYGEDAPVVEWRKSILEYKRQIIQDSKQVYKKPGLVEMLELGKASDIKMAVASSSPKAQIEYNLELEQIPDYFDIIISGDEVTKGKPNPEVFLKVCSRAGIAIENAIVLEDSPAGIHAAHNAGITSFHVKDDFKDLPKYEGSYKVKADESSLQISTVPADYVFNSLNEVCDFLSEKNLCL